ncbi:MAG: flagellar biosynthesis anti-sigma factor FlgM [Vicinamibacteria bacterium]
MEQEPEHDSRDARIAWLEEAIASGRYFVPAEVVARSLLRRARLSRSSVSVIEDLLVVLDPVHHLADEPLVVGMHLIGL